MVANRSLSVWMKPGFCSQALSVFTFFLLLFAFCASGSLSSAQAAYVQQCVGYTQYGSSVTCTFSSASTSGDAIMISYEGPAPTSVTATSGTPALVTNNVSSGGSLYAYALTNIAAGTYTITVNVSGNQRTWIAADEYSNVTSSPVDASGNGYNSGGYVGTINSSNLTTTAASDELWSSCFSDYAMSPGTAPITWTALPTDTLGSGGAMNLEDGTASTAGTYYGECTSSGVPYPQIVTVALLEKLSAAATPTFSPVAGTYTAAQTVTLSDTTSGATIYYTTNGTTPTTASSIYSSPLPVSTSQTIEAAAIASGYSLSAVSTAAYTINLPAAATPAFSPAAGTYASAQTVTITDSTSGTTIYYTTNGTTPTAASAVYSSAVTVSADETLEAIALAAGYSQSVTGSAAYAIEAATPGFSPAGGTYASAQTVTISDATSGASIYYTTNGTTPTTSSMHYSGAITISEDETLKAIATASGFAGSPVGSAAYSIEAATPGFSPAAGTYTSTQTVTITDATSGATIYYTTNGTTPTTASTIYSSAITVSATETVNAVAIASGYSLSPMGAAAYTIGSSGPPAYVQQCVGYTQYGSSVTCTFSSASTSGDAIMISYEGPAPTSVTATSGTPALVTNNVSSGGSLYAYALTNIAAGTYTITVNVSGNQRTWIAADEYSNVTSSPVDASGNGYNSGGYVGTINSSNLTTTAASDELWSSCFSDYAMSPGTAPITWTALPTDTLGSGGAMNLEDGTASTAGTYYGECTSSGVPYPQIVTVALMAGGGSSGQTATPTFSPAAGAYGPAQTVTISDSTSGASIYYTINGTTPTTASTHYSSPVTVSATETLEAIATASGDTNSAVASAVYTINGAVATPGFSPAAGTYTSTQTVTITDSTSGASIYYTTNGTTPTTASSTYSSAITVSATETLEAIAAKLGYSNSTVASATYTISASQVATPTFSPGAGSYSSAQTVTISDTTSGANIYYTTNGTTPTTASTHYSSAVIVSATETLEAIATHSGDTNSASGSAAYTIGASGAIYTVQHNSDSTEGGTSQAVPFTSNTTSGNVILVAESTYEGETPDAPTDTIGNSFTQLVIGTGGSGESVAAVYAATNKASGADTVTCNISASNNLHCHIYEVHGITTTVDQTGSSTVTSTSQTVSTSAATTNADDFIFAFFADNDEAILRSGSGLGDTDTSNNGGDNALTEDKVVVATGVQTATMTSSAADTDENVIVALKTTGTPTVSTPTLSPGTGIYISIQEVTISDWTAGSTIYYTTNGTTPTTASTQYTGAITVSVSQTIEAIGTASGFAGSSVGSAAYTINLPTATPGFSPVGGSYSSAQSVTISDATSGAVIYYTTNGFTPTTASMVYSSPVSVSVWETLQALAIAPGSSQSSVGVASYTIGNGEAAAPIFSPGSGDYDSAQTVTLSDSITGAAIYYTTNGGTPTTASTHYTSAISVSATETIKAIATASGYSQSGVVTGVFTINSTAGTCDGMSVGSSVAGTANMNGFVPFQSATTGVVSQWNTNIASAAIDPNNAAIQTTSGFAGEYLHINFGSSPGNGGIPFMIVDSGTTPKVPINVIDYASESDNVVAPYPNNVPIEGAAADCSGWPDTYQSDSHTNVLDRNGCWDYETYNTNRCNGQYDASGEVVWDMQNGEYRPWGWTSTDAAGLSVMAGLVKYDEAASGTIKHAIRFTMQQSKNDANGGYFVEPASHAAGTSYGAPTVEGMRLRLKSTFNISGYSAINQAILTALQQYGMIMADNGGYLYLQGATDSRWDNSDLLNLYGIPSSDFDVVQMSPSYPGWDSVTAPTGAAPVISSFTSSANTVSAGTPVTFNYSVSGDSYDYIDMIGPVRLTSGSGSVTVSPTATQTYTLYSVNQYGDNGAGAGYGVTVSTPITVVVPGSTVVPPTFTPVAGTYTAAQVITLNTTTYPYATIYYTTDGSTPTTNSTMYPQVPQPMSSEDVGSLQSITVSATSTIKAIAIAPGYSAPSAVSSASYTIN